MTAAEFDNATSASRPDRRRIAGRYRLQNRIGHGRLGDVFSAIDENYEALGVQQHVAIQIVPDVVARNDKLFNKLKAGYETLRAAAHPSIVDYRSFDRDGKFVYLVMELLDGASLRTVLDQAETLPPDEVRPVLRAVGEALQLLHAGDLVHGNVTTGNVFVTDDLEVRLLDVVPLGAADSLFHGAAMSGVSGHAAVGDDVFALACLAYQMLSGRHPFNHAAPPRARLAGLEPGRIDSLADREWAALRRALALDAEQRTSSVAEFLRSFGIAGTERLRQTSEDPAEERQAPVPGPAAAVPATSPRVEIRPDARPVRNKPGRRRAWLLFALLAALGAWAYLGQPGERFSDLIAYVDDSTRIAPAAPPQATRQPGPAEPAIVEADTAVPGDTVSGAASEPAADSTPEPAVEEAVVEIAAPIVSVSERDAAARIALRRVDDSESPLVWWTSEHTARADTDFVPVTRQVVDPAPGGLLLVPLINDGLPEVPESFFVNFGLSRAPQGKIERVATVRVDIVDDD